MADISYRTPAQHPPSMGFPGAWTDRRHLLRNEPLLSRRPPYTSTPPSTQSLIFIPCIQTNTENITRDRDSYETIHINTQNSPTTTNHPPTPNRMDTSSPRHHHSSQRPLHMRLPPPLLSLNAAILLLPPNTPHRPLSPRLPRPPSTNRIRLNQTFPPHLSRRLPLLVLRLVRPLCEADIRGVLRQ